MKVLLVGASGSIGTKRSGILEDLGHKVIKVDTKLGSYFSKELASDCDAVFICLPPNECADVALQCAEVGVPFFLEKPGAVKHRDLLPVNAKLQTGNLVNMVSCNLRFTSEYRAIQDSMPNIGRPLFAYAEFGYFLPWWREGQYRTYYSCYRVAGGGILMDAIHELDYMFSLFGLPDLPLGKGYKTCTSNILNTKELTDLDAEDTANIYLLYPSMLNMFIHLDYLQRTYKRVFFAIGTKGRIDQTFNIQGSTEMYRREMQHFLQCVKTGNQTIKPVEDHVKLLEFVDMIRPSDDKNATA